MIKFINFDLLNNGNNYSMPDSAGAGSAMPIKNIFGVFDKIKQNFFKILANKAGYVPSTPVMNSTTPGTAPTNATTVPQQDTTTPTTTTTTTTTPAPATIMVPVTIPAGMSQSPSA